MWTGKNPVTQVRILGNGRTDEGWPDGLEHLFLRHFNHGSKGKTKFTLGQRVVGVGAANQGRPQERAAIDLGDAITVPTDPRRDIFGAFGGVQLFVDHVADRPRDRFLRVRFSNR